MSNAFAENFAIPSATNTFQCVWKTTRAMKAAGWTTKASGDGTNKDTSGVAANDLWGGSTNPLQDSYPTAASTTIAAGSNGAVLPQSTINVASVAGFNPSGGTIYINGSVTPITYTACSGTTFTGCSGGSATLATGQTVKGLPALGDATVGWIVMSGPQTLKIALNAAPTGTPIRGEIVTQATSGATAELFGYVWDTVGLTGWMVLGPQTGTFDAAHTLTGSISGATLQPLATTTTGVQAIGSATINITSNVGFPAAGIANITTSGGAATVSYTGTTSTTLTGCTVLTGTGNTSNGGACGAAVVTFNREIMFAKTAASTVAGYIHYICADPASESGLLLSFLATQSGCTALIPPGCGGTSNRFDTSSPVTGGPLVMCVRGTQIAAGQFTTPDNWFASTTSFGSNSQIGCANNTPSAGVTADGSFYVGLSTTTANTYSGFFFSRVDDVEPGDCDPYVFFQTNSLNTIATPVFNRLVTTGVNSALSYSFPTGCFGNSGFISTGTSCFFGYQSRGNTVVARDVPCVYFGALTTCGYTSNAACTQSMLPTTQMKACCTPATTTPFVREPLSLFCQGGVAGTSRQAKGRTRWCTAYSAGTVLGTYDSKTWLCISGYGVQASQPAIAIGPYDGATTPLA